MSYKKLYIDIESAPHVAHVWGLWNVNVSVSQLRESGRTMCFAAQWRGSDKVLFYSEFHHGREEMIRRAHELLNEADVLVHFNGKKYDVPRLNREFLLEGMAPPAPFQQLDLLPVVRKFQFPSHKLSYIVEALGLGEKYSNDGHMLWVRCMAGDRKAWNEMRKYNKQDVVLLPLLEDRLSGWVAGGPNARLVTPGDEVCPRCGAQDALRKEGVRHLSSGTYQRYACRSCGGWSTGTRRIDGTDIRSFS